MNVALVLILLDTVQEASPGTLQLTGVLGLAAIVYGLYALRPKPDRGPGHPPYLRAAAPTVPSSAAGPTSQRQQGEASTSQQVKVQHLRRSLRIYSRHQRYEGR